MKTLWRKSKALLVLLAISFIGINAMAKSTVYLFTKGLMNSDVKVKINGDVVTNLNGPVKKTIKSDWATKWATDCIISADCYRMINFNEEGKIIVSVEIVRTDFRDLSTKTYYGEVQITLTPESVHYLQIASKGLFDLQLKEIKEKTSQKYLKKFVELPTYDYESYD